MGTNASPPSPIRWRRLSAGAVGFILLTAGIFWYQFSRIGVDSVTPQWEGLRWGYLGLLLLCLPLETVTCALRSWAITRVLEPRVGLWTCVKAEWANVAISTLTPTQSWGGPGQIYVLSRGGASLGTSLTIMLLGCIGTLIALLGLVLYSLLVAGADGAWRLFLAVGWSILGIGSVMAVVAVRPDLPRAVLRALARAPRMGRLAVKLGRLIETYRADATRFLRRGKGTFAVVCLLSLPFPIVRAVIAYLCLRFLGIEASDFGHVFQAQLLLVIFEFFAPSPGGAGVMEAASLAVMGETVSAGYAPYYNLLWRASTLYLPALAGFVCLGLAALQDACKTYGRRRLGHCRPSEGEQAWQARP